MPKSKKQTNNQFSKSEVMAAVAGVVDFMKQQVTNNLVDASNKGKFEVSNEDLKKICFYVESSITTSFMNASGQIESSMK